LAVGPEAFLGAGAWVGEGAALVGDDVEWEEGVELEEIVVFVDGVSVGDEGVGGTEFC